MQRRKRRSLGRRESQAHEASFTPLGHLSLEAGNGRIASRNRRGLPGPGREDDKRVEYVLTEARRVAQGLVPALHGGTHTVVKLCLQTKLKLEVPHRKGDVAGLILTSEACNLASHGVRA